ncbi:MAG TPA: PPK2 family polyphosphate kinase [Acidobacteriaceae bacterium]|nr:PPK2 family polyphosphate kinase [Acidobacteriaceae bacterium]
MKSQIANWDKYRVAPASKVRLRGLSTRDTSNCQDKPTARQLLKACRKEIDALLTTLAAEQARSLLVVLQGMDASGKDGTVRKVFTGVNPQYCSVVSFKQPGPSEQMHDYLWRIYASLPEKGRAGVFNRSHYEDIVVPGARESHPLRLIHSRLDQVRDIERIWCENGMTIVKFFLHISSAEQKRRFKARLNNPDKHWKVQESDFSDRRLWRRFEHIYQETLSRTSTKAAPWYVIPADHKWYRDLAIASIVRDTLDAMRPRLPHPKLNRGRFRL